MSFINKKLIILDRDGVINYDSAEFVKSPAEWRPLPGSLDAIKLFNDADKIVAIATNQSGIARGYFDEATLQAMHDKMKALLTEKNAHIDAIVFCPHGPDDNCDCRKPKSAMIEQLLTRFSVSADEAVLVGDSLRDLQAAENIGVEAVLVKTGKGEKTLIENKLCNPVFDNLLSVAKAMCDE